MEKQVYKAISAVTAEMGKEGISKARKNASQGYNFRGIDDVYNALNGALTRASLVIIPRIVSREVVERTSKSGSAMFYVTVAAEFDIVSAVDGSTHTARAYGEAQDNGDKATNKAMSAAYKYMAMQLFCIPTEGDNDADATTPEESIPQAPAKISGAATGIDFKNVNGTPYLKFTVARMLVYFTGDLATELEKKLSDGDKLTVQGEMKRTKDGQEFLQANAYTLG